MNERRVLLTCVALASMAAVAGDFVPSWRVPKSSAPYVRLEGQRLVARIPAGVTNVSAFATAQIDLSDWAQTTLEAEVACRAEAVAKPPRSRGIKLMLSYVDPVTGERRYPMAREKTFGTFDWTTLRLAVTFGEVPPAAGKAELMLGLQDTSGQVTFDLSTFRCRRAEPIFPLTDNDRRVAYPDRVRNLPRLRGVMGRGLCRTTERDIEDLHRLGATLVRLQMNGFGAKEIGATPRPLAEWDAWLAKNLDHAQEVLGWLEARGMKMALDLHCPPAGSYGSYCRTFYVQELADRFVSAWREIAVRFKGRAGLYGYDLMNEPCQQERALPGCDYWNLQRRAAEAIRAVDPAATVIVSANRWDGPAGYEQMRALEMDNVIYQVHVYAPSAYTHQGVTGGSSKGGFLPYPNAEKGWNKDFLRRQLRFARAFQLRHRAKMFVGEFSASAYAPGAENYLSDCIDLFEEYGWDWTYHSFRENPCWNVELGLDPRTQKLVPMKDTPRSKALVSGFRRPAVLSADLTFSYDARANRVVLSCADVKEPVRFQVAGDTHLALHDARDDAYSGNYARMAQYATPLAAFEKTLTRARDERVDLLLLAGDVISFPTLANVETVVGLLEKAGVDWLYTAGNHDWHFEGLPGSDLELRDGWTRKRLLPLYRGAADPLAYSKVCKGVRFVMIDNSTYRIVPSQLDFWRKEVATGDPIVVVLHCPLWYPGQSAHSLGCEAWGWESDPYWEIERRQRWDRRQPDESFALREEILSAPNVIGVFAGHLHRLQMASVRGRPLFTVPSNRDGAVLDVLIVPPEELPALSAPARQTSRISKERKKE